MNTQCHSYSRHSLPFYTTHQLVLSLIQENFNQLDTHKVNEKVNNITKKQDNSCIKRCNKVDSNQFTHQNISHWQLTISYKPHALLHPINWNKTLAELNHTTSSHLVSHHIRTSPRLNTSMAWHASNTPSSHSQSLRLATSYQTTPQKHHRSILACPQPRYSSLPTTDPTLRA